MILYLPSTRRTGPPALLVGLLLAVSLAACGGASGTGNDGVVSLASPSAAPGASGSPAASMDPEEAVAAFTACMKEHGVDIQIAIVSGGGTGGVTGGPSVNSSGPGTAGKPQAGSGEFDPEKQQEADEACRHLLPSGMLGDPTATIPPEQVEAALAFAKCMREHGIDYPDPQFSGNGMSVHIGAEGPDGKPAIDPSSATFQAAQEACGTDVPGGAPFSVGGSPTEVKP
jgi:hypothetical protein